MSIEFDNNASGTNSVQIEIVDTTLTLQTGEGALFPSVTTASGDFFYATLEDTSGNIEIVKCTDNTSDVLTVTRAQENTTAKQFLVGSKVEQRTTAATFAEFIQRTGGVMTGMLDMDGQDLQDPVLTSTGAAAIKGIPIQGTDGGTSNEIIVPTAGGAPTLGASAILTAATGVQSTRTLTGGEGIATLGDLSADRTVDLDVNSLAAMTAAELASDDEVLVYDVTAAEHKRMASEDAGTRVKALTTSRNAVISDNNALLYGDGTNRTFTLPDSIFHIGSELAIVAPGAGTVTVATSGSQTVVSLSSNTIVKANGGGAYLALYATNTWILVGDLE